VGVVGLALVALLALDIIPPERAYPVLERLGRFTPAVPWLTAVIVLAAGVFLTSQALTQPL
jgi:hypothetical protein